ncbi:hypothetical protein IG631_08299 [Alternaria alternata]|nr:hypothetical protein IG631_08299 [Alternaria alternata]
MAIKVTLHCPSTEKTKKDSIIRNPEKHFNLLYDIRSIFRTNYAAVYDIRAKPIDNLRNCVSGQIVQVAISRDETMKYYKPWNCIMYNGEDSANVDWMTDGVGLAWKMCTQHDVGTAIFYNWNWKWEVFLPASMMPDDPKDMSPKVLSLLTVLSSFTHGSARKVRAYIIEAVKARLAEPGDGGTKDPLLQEEDIVHVISTLYEKAVSPKAKDYLAEENKVKERARKETWSMSRRPEGTRKEKA